MAAIQDIFALLPERYNAGRLDRVVTAYFSVGPEKWSVVMDPDKAEATPGRPSGSADFVLKVDPRLFEKMVVDGKKPGPLDVARGRIKTNDVAMLKRLPELFRLGR
ncbi:MAG: hypothetical protein VX265_02300 [Myxococcota bacterium]|nr:hypothetical protein [Myxococcota bacterium]